MNRYQAVGFREFGAAAASVDSTINVGRILDEYLGSFQMSTSGAQIVFLSGKSASFVFLFFFLPDDYLFTHL